MWHPLQAQASYDALCDLCTGGSVAECVVALAGPDPAARYPAANSPLEYLGLLLEELDRAMAAWDPGARRPRSAHRPDADWTTLAAWTPTLGELRASVRGALETPVRGYLLSAVLTRRMPARHFAELLRAPGAEVGVLRDVLRAQAWAAETLQARRKVA
jgi:hypothetical protein